MINGNNRSAWGAPRSHPPRSHDHGTPAAFAPFRPRSPREERQRPADGVHLRRTAQPGPAGGSSARLTTCAKISFRPRLCLNPRPWAFTPLKSPGSSLYLYELGSVQNWFRLSLGGTGFASDSLSDRKSTRLNS